MKIKLTESQRRRLISEELGVPKSVDFWVGVFTTLVEEALFDVMDSNGGDVKLDSLSLSGGKVMTRAIDMGWSPDSTGFKELPLVEPSLDIRLGVAPDDYIQTGEHYIQNGQFSTENVTLSDITFTNGETTKALMGGAIELTLTIPEEHLETGSLIEFYRLDIKPYVESLFYHELTHVVEYYNRLLGGEEHPGTEVAWMLASNRVSSGILAEWDTLTYLIYLHTSFELNARVVEMHGLIKGFKIKTKEEFIKFVTTHRIWKKAKELRDFKAQKFYSGVVIPNSLKLEIESREGSVMSDSEVKDYAFTALIQNWVSNYDDVSKSIEDSKGERNSRDLKTSMLESPMGFLKFWEKRFNRTGEDSIRKIGKLYGLL